MCLKCSNNLLNFPLEIGCNEDVKEQYKLCLETNLNDTIKRSIYGNLLFFRIFSISDLPFYCLLKQHHLCIRHHLFMPPDFR